jgi:hypothetical protein
VTCPGVVGKCTPNTTPGVAKLNIAPSLGSLKAFSGSGYAQTKKWVPLPVAKIDFISNALRISGNIGSVSKALHLGVPTNIPTPPGTNQLTIPASRAGTAPTASTGANAVLPQQVSQITLSGLDTATFGLGKLTDTTREGAVIQITLYF